MSQDKVITSLYDQIESVEQDKGLEGIKNAFEKMRDDIAEFEEIRTRLKDILKHSRLKASAKVSGELDQMMTKLMEWKLTFVKELRNSSVAINGLMASTTDKKEEIMAFQKCIKDVTEKSEQNRQTMRIVSSICEWVKTERESLEKIINSWEILHQK
ncbi:hypothetical protein RFI_04593, partial [Reticulomyxa filosa]